MAVIGIVLGYVGMVHGHPPSELGWRTLHFWSFFTNLSNLAVALAGFGYARHGGALHRWATRPGTRTAIAVYILIVAVVFEWLLAGIAHFGVLGLWSNLFVHQIVPVGWLLCWLAFGPHGGTRPFAPIAWLAVPLAYAGWTIVHGLASGWYPYPFIDAARLGWPATLRNMVLFTILFAGLGALFRWIDERLGKRAARRGLISVPAP